MRRKQAHTDPGEAHAARLAWWAAFVTTVILVLGLSLVRNAEAATPPGGAPAATPLLALLPFEEAEEDELEEEGEEAEFEAEACELEEEVAEEGGEELEFEECEAEEEEEDEGPPAECRLESADAAVSADLVHRKLRLALRYTARRSTPIVVKPRLRGRRGSLTLKKQRKHLGRGGVLRSVEKLTPSQAKKVAAAKAFTIEVRPAGAPRYCSQYLDQRLAVRRGDKSRPTWIDSDSTFRHARHG